MKVGVISLGCDKNRVDTEKMLARLVEEGIQVTNNQNEADVIIINTCAFIEASKKESIDEILNTIESKKLNQKILVTGCLTQRYGKDIKDGFPEIKGFMGVCDYDNVVATVKGLMLGKEEYIIKGEDKFYPHRELTTPYHYAYLKIADGCNNHCTYCAIPGIRGPYVSYKISDLMEEAKELSDNGVKELILVAQDVSRYGLDFDGKSHLIELLDNLLTLDFTWIRLMYLYPEMVSDELIEYVHSHDRICNYMDVPFQHASNDILKRMGRKTNKECEIELIKKLKERHIAIRSSFIVGFPGETEEEFNELKELIEGNNIQYGGFFEYSKEEGTPAAKMSGQITKGVKTKRAKALYKAQAKAIKVLNKELIGKVLPVLYDEIDYDKQMFVGRTEYQAPDVDTVCYFTSDEPVNIGDFYDVEITGTDGLDLVGRVIWK